MKRTIYNCTLIEKCVRKGIGEPQRFPQENLCCGYAKSEYDDEPCEQCGTCRLNLFYEDGV